MSLDWSAHICTYYCQGTVHAVPILAMPTVSLATITNAMRLGLTAGETLVELRPAHEADVARWHEQFASEWTAWGAAGSHGHSGRAVPPTMSVPYLALIRLQKDSLPTDPPVSLS